ncbi:MAG: excalibur calcium-binding domain-containing protein [Alphaproteobacteria bacterium]|nr:MAG: excalibur calcium-binding domain-containing protein [Alphaproteobacteria bacterium]
MRICLLLNQLEQGHFGIGHRRLLSGSSSHPNPTEDRRWPPYPRPLPTPRPGTLPQRVLSQLCAAPRAAGAAPVRTGQPGYRPGLDRDGDGVGCE